jgi:hypothetical protein
VEASELGAWEVLRSRLPQLRFPVRAGISATEAYRAATRRGEPVEDGEGLVLRSPERLCLWVEDSLAGPVPVLRTADRGDFVLLVQALSGRNEPEPIPDSMGACLVSGFNNWDRVRAYREHWREAGPGRDEAAWAEEFRRLIPRKELYQDRFLILTEGPYSNVPAAELGLPAEEWLRLSSTIRLAHECAHYLALRLFGAVPDQPRDELIADYVGIAAACGRFRADWFLRFVGLEAYPNYREGGRLENYRGKPPLSDTAMTALRCLVHTAAVNLERFDASTFPDGGAGPDRARLVPGLSLLTLEELAAGDWSAYPGRLPSRNSPTDVSAQ